MSSLFRCAGDIVFDDTSPQPGQICNVQLKQYSETCNFLQYLHPLTPQHPYFFAQIRASAHHSKIAIGIAGPDIAEDAHPGNWNNSVGYHSDTGKCYTSHNGSANTDGEKFGIGDMFGVLVTYFGKKMSTVVFLKNSKPVATRYLFEPDHSLYLPTVSLENGPIDLGLMWPEAVIGIPQYSEKNMLHWICPIGVQYSMVDNMFAYNDTEESVAIQSPLPLSADIQHFEVIVQEVSPTGLGPAITLATCSPLKPTPTSKLSKDFIRWHPDGNVNRLSVGQRMGWGVHYNPSVRNLHDFDAREEQLVLCYVTIDMKIMYIQMLLQPPGGFYPLVVLFQDASKVTIDMESNSHPVVTDKLDMNFNEELEKASKKIASESLTQEIKVSMFRKSPDILIDIQPEFCRLRLPANRMGIHIVQFQKPLAIDSRYFFIEVTKMNEDSVVALGVAGSKLPLNKFPGKLRPSVGWVSRDGKLFYNEQSDGNMPGERFREGDTVGVEIDAFASEMSVALFTKNHHPVGTRFLTQPDRAQFLPTVALCGNGYELEVVVFWQTQVLEPRSLNVMNPENWCLPPGSVADPELNMVFVRDHDFPVALQAPYSLHTGYNHFEVQIIDDFDDANPPPALALSSASPLDPPPPSNFKQDFLRFWATGSAKTAVKVGDIMGWGLLYFEESLHQDEEQLVICYLTVNRNVLLTRVIYQPPGGFYPLIILPPGLNQVKMEFGATVISDHPFSKPAVDILVKEAKELIDKEEKLLAQGGDLDDLNVSSGQLFRPLPEIPEEDAQELSNEPQSGKLKTVDNGSNLVVEEKKQKPGKGGKALKHKPSKGSLGRGDHTKSKSCTIL